METGTTRVTASINELLLVDIDENSTWEEEPKTNVEVKRTVTTQNFEIEEKKWSKQLMQKMIHCKEINYNTKESNYDT